MSPLATTHLAAIAILTMFSACGTRSTPIAPSQPPASTPPAAPALTASLSVNPNPAALDQPTSVAAIASGLSPLSGALDFGDGTRIDLGAVGGAVSGIVNGTWDTVHVYPAAGTFSAVLTVTTAGGATASATRSVVVQ